MAEELEISTGLLNAALERYSIICTRLRNQYKPGAGFDTAPPELTGRLIAELSRISAYETEIQYPKAIINKFYNISESNTTISINRFPPEMLARIFHHVIETRPCPMFSEKGFDAPTKVAFFNDPIMLSHVCSHWRRIAISTATLWSHINIYLARPIIPVLMARLDAYLVRSAQSPVDLHIAEQLIIETPRHQSSVTIDTPADSAYLQFLAAIAPRMRSLTFIARHRIPSGNLVPSILSTCFANATPGVFTKISICPLQEDHGVRSIFPVAHGDSIDAHSQSDELTGPSSKSTEAVWLHVRVLQLRVFRLKWVSKAFHDLAELRLVGGGDISQSDFSSILKSSPQLRVLELGLSLSGYIPENKPPTPIRLDYLEILVIRGSKEQQVVPFLQSIAPGSEPLSLSLVNPWLGTSDRFVSKEALAQFSARSNIVRFNGHEFNSYAQLAEVLSLMPSVRVVGVYGIRCRAIDEESHLPPGTTFETLYVIVSSMYAQFSWPSVARFVEKHCVQKLILWQYDFRHCGLGHPGRETIPENLYSVCSEVKVVPDTEPNPIVEWT